MKRTLPPSASVAHQRTGARLHAPAATRNTAALIEVLRGCAPQSGSALELASGTGQHVAAFADAFPRLCWHPTEVDAARRASIDAHVRDAGAANVAPASHLDATVEGWNATLPAQDLIVLANLLHLISTPQAKTVLREAARALLPGGVFVLYGPFSRGGALTSDGDRRFDADLRAADPEIGYKDEADIRLWLAQAGLTCEVSQMPANNLAFTARKPRP